MKCKQCQIEKDVSEFSKAKTNPYREYQNNCKKCQASNAREHYKKNKAKKSEITKLYFG